MFQRGGKIDFNHLKVDYDCGGCSIELDGRELKCQKVILILEVGEPPQLFVGMNTLSGEVEIENFSKNKKRREPWQQ